MWAAVMIALVAAPVQPGNLLPNGGFERDADGNGVPDGWRVEIHTREGAEGRISISTENPHSGRACVKIEHTSERGWVRISVMEAPALPNTVYRFTGWVRGNCRYAIIVYEFTAARQYISHGIARGKAPAEWTKVSATVRTGDIAQSFKVSLITETRGVAYFDDVELVAIASRPSMLVPSVARPPVIDGKLDDKCWKRAAKAEVGYVLGGEGAQAPIETVALAVRDERMLYVAFRCEEPLADKLSAQASADKSAWAQDRVEVYVGADAGSYNHYGVAASGRVECERQVRAGRFYRRWWRPAESGGEVKIQLPRAAAQIGEGEWTAELAIPLKDVGRLQPGKPWRAQFCRVRLVGGEEEDFTWGYTPGDRFAQPEYFGVVVFEGPMGRPALVISAAKRPVQRPVVVPQPRKIQWTGKDMRLGRRVEVVLLGRSEGPAEMAAEFLADVLGDLGVSCRIRSGASGRAREADVVVGWGRKLPAGLGAAGLPAEGYRLKAGPDGVAVAGRDELGAAHGLYTVAQLVYAAPDGARIAGCGVEDWPDIKIRGWHCSSPYGPEVVADWKRALRLWAALKYNLVVLEVNGRMKYRRHPDAGGGLTPEELREVVDYARKLGLEPVPQLATFGHFNYILRREKFRHLGERYKKPDGTWDYSTWNYCPSNPEVYRLVFDMMDELIDVFRPKYFHIGHDEASFGPIGTCPECSKKKPWELWAEDINRLHRFLTQRGLRVMLWAEQFLVHRNGGPPHNTAKALPLIPKDLIMLHWQYSPVKEQPDIKFFLDSGFETWGCPWYWGENVYYMAQEVKRYGAQGFLGTTWYSVQRVFHERAWLEAAWVTGAENAWTTGRPKLEAIGYSPLEVARRLAYAGQRRAGRKWAIVDLQPYCNETTVAGREGGWDGRGPEYDLRLIKPGVRWVGGVPVMLLDGRKGPACVMLADSGSEDRYPMRTWRIGIGQSVRALYFLHCTSLPKKRPLDIYDRNQPGRVGYYVITYEDGETEEVDLVYWRNIDDWNSPLGPAEACGVLRGKTAAGALVNIGLWRWDNPRPDKKVAGVEMVSLAGAARPILLGITAELE